MKKVINTKKSPAPIGPYSQAVINCNTLYISGQIPMNPETNELVMNDIKSQAKQVMENLKNILTESSMDFRHVVKTTIFLTDMKDFADVNDVYGSYFSSDFPARETVQVSALPKNVNVEISMIAVR